MSRQRWELVREDGTKGRIVLIFNNFWSSSIQTRSAFLKFFFIHVFRRIYVMALRAGVNLN